MAEPRIQDDLYQHVNGAWAKTATIPDDKPTTGGFSDLAESVEQTLMADFEAVATGTKEAPDTYFKEAVALYQKAKDFKVRDEAGINPVLPRLERLAAVSDLATFNAQAATLDAELFPLPFDAGVEPDMKDTKHNSFTIAGPSTILPDTTYYQAGNEQGPKLLALWQEMAQAVLAYTDLDLPTQKLMIADAVAFDQAIAKRVKSAEAWADYPKAYNPQPFEQVAAQFGDFDFTAYADGILPKRPSTVIVADPHFLETFSELFNAASFTQYAHWAYVLELLSNTGYLSEELRQLGGQFSRALSGLPAAPSQEKHAYRLANNFFSEPIGIYYGRTYFGEQAKTDVTELVEAMIATYKRRLADSLWLSQPTKDKAIVKLDHMVLKMGYPETPHALYAQLHVDPTKDLLTNVLTLAQQRHAYRLSQLVEPVDRSEWNMPGHLVNASYDPSRNDITFPAAILQAPFYALNQSASANLGGIGAVIAHEISHGFDNNGAQFDEYGNLADWWQEADYDHFKALTQQMIAQFDGLETPAGPVNGKLVVSENIADAGGLAAALDTAQQREDVDLEAFFLNWARIWRQKARLQYQQLLLAIDVHAPAVLRANVQVQNLAAWYQTFDVQAEDGMYLPEDKRLTIW